VRLRTKKAPFAGEARAFSPKIVSTTLEKERGAAPFSFREMSNVKALARISLPTLRQVAREGVEIRTLKWQSSARAPSVRSFGSQRSGCGLRFGAIIVSYAMFLQKSRVSQFSDL
jgi:hypothetical protein